MERNLFAPEKSRVLPAYNQMSKGKRGPSASHLALVELNLQPTPNRHDNLAETSPRENAPPQKWKRKTCRKRKG
ncbi:unnamed protein product [Parnassius apollo]|uniref:(apollo) hypothetical protein n=1 Tax=Parnassius apollo TaxID=110799 RepID=A0A8S3XDM3_PARAO|nr:unnamed protein product [Parnassius apollo]